jgi:hypothetical protein
MNERQFEKRWKILNKKHLGKCTYCRKPYGESCHTFIGLDFEKKVQDVGYCCRSKLATVVMGGVYIEDIDTPRGKALKKQLTTSHPYAEFFCNPSGETKHFKH